MNWKELHERVSTIKELLIIMALLMILYSIFWGSMDWKSLLHVIGEMIK